MDQIEFKPLTAAELRQIQAQAEQMRAQMMMRFLRKLSSAALSPFSAPSCARPLRPH